MNILTVSGTSSYGKVVIDIAKKFGHTDIVFLIIIQALKSTQVIPF